MMSSPKTADFKPGDRVTFGRPSGEKTLGEVVKVNVRTLQVKQLETRGGARERPVGTMWKVAPSCCVKEGQERTPAQDMAMAFADGGIGQELDALAALAAAARPAVPKRTEAELMAAILGVYTSLSPENLSCDGELPRAQIAKRRTALNRELAALTREIGRHVSEEEAWRAYDAARDAKVAAAKLAK